jgi:hypothetical protein
VFKVTPSMLREHWGTVTGSEHELGVLDHSGRGDFDEACMPPMEFLDNGGRVYRDVGHPEICTAEASNPLQLVALERAMERRATRLGLSADLYKNCVDFSPGIENNTYAAHENYFTQVPADSIDAIIPFLISRTIFTGAGDTSLGEYTLSQRAPHIACLRSEQTLWNRPLLHDRDESLSSVPRWRRLHVIHNDANMCAAAILLKHGTTMLVLRLLERNSLEHLPYNEFQAIDDLHRLNRQTCDWQMRGVRPLTMKAVDVQGFYLNQVASKLPNPSPLERLVISMWREVLTRLSTDPAETFGLVDWTTKRSLINQIRASSDGRNYLPQTIDLTYHNIDRSVGLYFGLEAEGRAERLVSPTTVRHYASTPPRTTRAWARGQAIKLGEQARVMGLGDVEVCCTWQFVNVYVNGSSDKDLCIPLSDPRRSYVESIDALKRRLGAL